MRGEEGKNKHGVRAWSLTLREELSGRRERGLLCRPQDFGFFFTRVKGGSYKEASSSSTRRIRARVIDSCWSAWPDLGGTVLPQLPGVGESPDNPREGLVVKET